MEMAIPPEIWYMVTAHIRGHLLLQRKLRWAPVHDQLLQGYRSSFSYSVKLGNSLSLGTGSVQDVYQLAWHTLALLRRYPVDNIDNTFVITRSGCSVGLRYTIHSGGHNMSMEVVNE